MAQRIGLPKMALAQQGLTHRPVAAVAVILAGCTPLGALAQFCGPAPSMPYRALVKVIDDENFASDLSVAAGLSRVVVASNSRLRIHCKSGFATSSEMPLSAPSIANAVLAETPSPFDHNHTFDPRVIYDGYDGRFWLVAAEDDEEASEGRLHIAVSGAGATDGEIPQNWSSTYWVKFTGDGTGAAGASLDPANSTIFSPDQFDTGHIPDRPTIAVDRDFLYISVREGTQGLGADYDRMMLIVMCKADLIAGTPTVVTSQFIDLETTTRTSVHTLAVDDTIADSGLHRVYMVTLPNLYAMAPGAGSGDHFDSIRVGAFTGTGTFGDCGASLEWEYEATNVALDEADEFYGMSFTAIDAKGAASGDANGQNALVTGSLFMNAMTRTLGDGDRRIWCIHNILPDDEAVTSELQWYQINLHDWPDTGSPGPDFDRVERIALTDPNSNPLNVFDGAISANECEDVAVGFTRGAYYNGSTWTYPQFWKALYPYGSSPTIAVAAAGASQYYDPGNTAWADFAGMAADPDPGHMERFYGLHMTGHDDDSDAGGVSGQRTKSWEGWLATFNFGSCGSSLRADFDEDQDVDGDDLWTFEAYAGENNSAADLDDSNAVDVLDLLLMLDAVGQEGP